MECSRAIGQQVGQGGKHRGKTAHKSCVYTQVRCGSSTRHIQVGGSCLARGGLISGESLESGRARGEVLVENFTEGNVWIEEDWCSRGSKVSSNNDVSIVVWIVSVSTNHLRGGG